MGEVFLARDTRLDREVAVKVASERFAERFDREAHAIAALNHPNICHLYDVGPNYLVMERIDGVALKGPLPLDRALEYASQILDALDAAHSKGIVHRDLKPTNILLTKKGIKLLDFGLAKRCAPLKDAQVTDSLTTQGQIVGTLNYMSPEQLEGKEADTRTDIFSFGLVLYEMLTGTSAFVGTSVASVIAAILELDSPSLAHAAPPAVERVLQRCLAKDPEQRWQSARDLKAALQLAAGPPQASRAPKSASGGWIAAGCCLLLVLVAGWYALQPAHVEERTFEFKIEPPPGTEFVLGVGGGNAISPDGRTLAFVAVSTGSPKLWVRSMDSTSARELPGVEGAQFPFWAPNSQSLGFFANGKLQRIDLSGGPPVTLADAPNGRGGTWSSQGMIIYSPSAAGGLFKVPAAGGLAAPLTTLDNSRRESTHRWPLFLPDGRHFLYLARGDKTELDGIYLCSLEHPEQTTRVLETPLAASYSPPHDGHPEYLYWVRDETLFAQPFKSANARVTGDPFPVPGGQSLFVALAPGFGRTNLSVSNNGTLFFGTGGDRYDLVWLDRKGNRVGTVGQTAAYASVRIGPDGKRLSVALFDSSGQSDMWLMDTSRGVPSRLTFDDGFGTASWSPDGQQVAYHLLNKAKLFKRSTSGTGSEEIVLQSQRAVYLNDWSFDGRFIVYSGLNAQGRTGLWLLPMNGDRRPVPFLDTSFDAFNGRVSPDGKWIAYIYNATGRLEVYVQSFPQGPTRSLVSSNGGNFPLWRRDGKELFYRALDGQLMAVPVRIGSRGLEFGTPQALFRIPEAQGQFAYPYDVALDGQTFLTLVPSRAAGTASLNVLVNWAAAQKR